MSRFLRVLAAATFAAGVGGLACSSSNISPATLTNVVDTITLYSLTTGPLNEPNAYSLNAGTGVETWNVGANFEFAFGMDPSGAAEFLPLEVLDLTLPNAVLPGLIRATNTTFDAMTQAPQNGWVTSDTIPLLGGDLFYIRTGVNTCASLGVPLYGKLEVLSLDTAAQSVTFQAMADQNCGYRGLKLGLPSS